MTLANFTKTAGSGAAFGVVVLVGMLVSGHADRRKGATIQRGFNKGWR